MGYFEEYDVTKLSKTSDIIPQVYAIAPTNYSDRKIGTLGKKICILVEPETLSPVQVASTGILNITSTNTTPYGVYCDSNNIATSATGIVLQTFLTTNSIVNTGANNAGGGNSGTPAICGSANGSSGSIVPVANLCGGSSTLSGSVTGNGPWNWTCASSDG